MAVPTPTLHHVETMSCTEGSCTVDLYFFTDASNFDGHEVAVMCDGEEIESGDPAFIGGNTPRGRIDAQFPQGISANAQICFYTGSGSNREESLSNTITFTPAV